MQEYERQQGLYHLAELGIDFAPSFNALNPQQCGRGQVTSILPPEFPAWKITNRELWLIFAILTLMFLVW